MGFTNSIEVLDSLDSPIKWSKANVGFNVTNLLLVLKLSQLTLAPIIVPVNDLPNPI